MPRTIAKDFRIEWLQILDEHGNCDQSLRPSLTDQQIKKLYEELVFARTFDEKAFKLQREGRLGTYASILGQEAAQVASAFALEPGDWMFPSFREPGASFVRGLPPRMILQYWAGDERGSNIPEGQNDFPITIPVGTQIPIGAGAAWGAKLRGDKIAVLVYLGDGATSKGDFHEGLNLAGVFSLPVVFFCQNNQWAISEPIEKQSRIPLYQRALGFGFPGIRVDGNDVLACYAVSQAALQRAREGSGPTFVEAYTYRMGAHIISDDPTRYRVNEELEHWNLKDPIARVKAYLVRNGVTDDKFFDSVDEDADEIAARLRKGCLEMPDPSPLDIFDQVYEDESPELVMERDQFATYLASFEGAH